MTHDLKVWSNFYPALAAYRKRFEVRKDDRGFKVGDRLVLREWNPPLLIRGIQVRSADYTGRRIELTVTYILRGPAFGIRRGWVVMSLKP